MNHTCKNIRMLMLSLVKIPLSITTSTLAQKALHVFMSNWMNYLVHFALGVYIVRMFGAEGKGIYSLLTASSAMIGVVFSLSLNNGVIYYVKQSKITPRLGLLMVIRISLCVTFVVAIIFWLFKDFIWKLFFNESEFSSFYLIMLVAYIPILLVRLYLVSYYLTMHRTGKHMLFVSTSSLMTLIATILSVSFLNIDIAGALFVLIIIDMIYVIYFSMDIYRFSSAPDIKKFSIFNIFSYGMRSHLAVLGNTVIDRVDLLIVAAYLSPKALGYYSVAKYFYQAILSIPGAINGLLFGTYCDRGPVKALQMNVKVVLLMTALLFFVMSLAFVFGAPFIKFFYGTDFLKSVPALNILLFATVLRGSSSSYHHLFLACDRPQLTSKIEILSGIVHVFMTFVLVPRFSLEGAAMGTISGSLCIAVLRLYYGYKVKMEYFVQEGKNVIGN